ncbi:hypothetical protein BLA29_011756, partial [Euroglyphus maynei]
SSSCNNNNNINNNKTKTISLPISSEFVVIDTSSLSGIHNHSNVNVQDIKLNGDTNNQTTTNSSTSPSSQPLTFNDGEMIIIKKISNNCDNNENAVQNKQIEPKNESIDTNQNNPILAGNAEDGSTITNATTPATNAKLSSAKRKLLILARLFRPWRWKRKSNKGINQ